MSSLFLALGTLLASTDAQAQFPFRMDTSLVTVSRGASASVSPARASMFLEVGSTGASPEVAATGLVRTGERVLAALAEAGFGPESVSPRGLGVGPALERGRFPGARDGSQEARCGLRVELGVEEVEAAVSAALGARGDAEAMAAAAGGSLGPLVGMSSTPDHRVGLRPQDHLATMGSYRGQGVRLVPATVDVRVQVQVSWRFAPR